MSRDSVAIIGGGWAGLACAVTLADAAVPVTLYESARQLGGRARALVWDDLTVDNGQHLMLGAYRETLGLLQRLGSLEHVERHPLELRLPGLQLALPKWPAPWHLVMGLLRARGLTWGEKLAAVRFMRALQGKAFSLERDMPVSEFLQAQPAALVDKLWAPLCIAALTTPLEQASAQVFCNVLRDGLMGPREDSDLVMNRSDLGQLLPAAAVAFLRLAGVDIRLSSRVDNIRHQDGGFFLEGPDQHHAQVVLATHASHVAELTQDLAPLAGVHADLARFTWQPIVTLWLRFASPPVFPFPMLALGHGQTAWAFERSDLAKGSGHGVVSIVESAEGPHLSLAAEALLAAYAERLQGVLGPLPPLLAWKLVKEKRAAHTCSPDLQRPGNATPLPGLFLAGDYTRGPYPATLEGAVRSGLKCARLILEQS